MHSRCGQNEGRVSEGQGLWEGKDSTSQEDQQLKERGILSMSGKVYCKIELGLILGFPGQKLETSSLRQTASVSEPRGPIWERGPDTCFESLSIISTSPPLVWLHFLVYTIG